MWDATKEPGMPDELESMLLDKDVLIWAHNAAFERLILKNVLQDEYSYFSFSVFGCCGASK